MLKKLFSIAAVISMSLASHTGFAASTAYTYAGATGSQNWNVTTNWSPSGTPGTTASFDSITKTTLTTTVTLAQNTGSAVNLYNISISGNSGLFTITNTGGINLTGTGSSPATITNSSTGTGSININTGTITLGSDLLVTQSNSAAGGTTNGGIGFTADTIAGTGNITLVNVVNSTDKGEIRFTGTSTATGNVTIAEGSVTTNASEVFGAASNTLNLGVVSGSSVTLLVTTSNAYSNNIVVGAGTGQGGSGTGGLMSGTAVLGGATAGTVLFKGNVTLNDNLYVTSNSTTTTGVNFSGIVSGTGGVKINTGGSAGTVQLATNNTFAGGTFLSGGILEGAVDTVLTAGAITSSPFGKGTLTLTSGTIMTAGSSLARTYDNPVTINGANVGFGVAPNGNVIGLAEQIFDSGVVGNSFTLSNAATLTVNQEVEINEPIVSASGSTLTKAGGGLLLLNATNTTSFAGGVTLLSGTLQTRGSSVVSEGAIVTGPLGTGTLTLIGGSLASDSSSASRTYHNALVLNGTTTFGTVSGVGSTSQTFSAAAGNATSLTGPSTLNLNNSLEIDQTISSPNSSSLTLNGPGILILGALNTFSGGVVVNSGTLESAIASVTGTTSFGTGKLTLNGGSTLISNLSSGTRTYYNSLAINGPVTLGATAGTGSQGQTFTDTVGGATTITGGSSSILTINSPTTLNQVITTATSAGNNLVKSGPATLTLSDDNQMSGVTINAGMVSVDTALRLGPTPTSFNPGEVVLNSGTLQYTASFVNVVFSANRGIQVANGGGGIDVTGTNQVVTSTVISNLTTNGQLNKTDTGTLTLNGVSTYTGGTVVSSGTLNVNGTLDGASTVSVANVNAALAGTGTVGSIDSYGLVAPGLISNETGFAVNSGAGTLTAKGTLTLESTGTLALALNGATAGSYGQLVSGSGVTLGSGAALSLTLGYTPNPGDVFTIVSNPGSAVAGTFSLGGVNLANGDSFSLTDPNTSQQDFFNIFYDGGAEPGAYSANANDIDIVAAPEPSTWLSIASGAAVLLLGRRRRRTAAAFNRS